MEEYCNKCKDYLEHEQVGEFKTCKVCGDIYEENRKRYVICGPKDDATVIRATEEMLKKDATAIIINEEVALKHRLKGIPTESIPIKNYDLDMINHIEDMRYSHLTKKQKEAVIEPIRTEPKIQRNEPCSCGSGKKYKKCCYVEKGKNK